LIYREYTIWSQNESEKEAKLWQSQEIGTIIGKALKDETKLHRLVWFQFIPWKHFQ
jgi:hypothetical protein